MRIACLQFSPRLRHVKENIQLAESLLDNVQPNELDLLVLPELAFTGMTAIFSPRDVQNGIYSVPIQFLLVSVLTEAPSGYTFPSLKAIKPVYVSEENYFRYACM
jgi:predicted amidohydrolase